MPESFLERNSNVEHRTRSINTKHVIDSWEELTRWILQPRKSVDWSRFRGRIRAENVHTQIFSQIDGHRTNPIKELELRIRVGNEWCRDFWFTPRQHTYETNISNVVVIFALVNKLRTGIKYQVVSNVVVQQSINQMILVRNPCFFPATMTGIETRHTESFGDFVGCVEMQRNSRSSSYTSPVARDVFFEKNWTSPDKVTWANMLWVIMIRPVMRRIKFFMTKLVQKSLYPALS